MSRRAFIPVMVLCLALGAAAARADFYVVPVAPGAGTEIRSLPYTISSPGFYYIKRDLTSAGAGITVDASNVTIDLMGNSLVGPGSGGGCGVLFGGLVTNVEIRNGTVTNWGFIGIYGQDQEIAKSNRVINVRAIDNGDMGIDLLGRGHIIMNCTASYNGDHGINAGMGSTVRDNVAAHNDGAGILAGTGSNLTGNTTFRNDQHGIFSWGHSFIAQNASYDNSKEAPGTYANIHCETDCAWGLNYQ